MSVQLRHARKNAKTNPRQTSLLLTNLLSFRAFCRLCDAKATDSNKRVEEMRVMSRE